VEAGTTRHTFFTFNEANAGWQAGVDPRQAFREYTELGSPASDVSLAGFTIRDASRAKNYVYDGDTWGPADERYTIAATSAPDQALALWWLPHADAQAPTLLYLHGTFRTLYGNAPKIDALRRAGFSVLAVDYRGWGDSTSIVPTEATINADARLAWAELQRRQPVPGRRVIFGHSMGTAVAVTLASNLRHGDDYAALVLEAAFTRMPDIAAEAGYLGRVAAALTTLDFNSLAKIGRVDAPILMLHGDADRTVPIVLGQRLRDAAKPGVRWVEVPGGSHSRLHSDAPEVYQRAFADLIQSARLKP
jgi:pimeloyl-ACP methyl ester carboxylesterase